MANYFAVYKPTFQRAMRNILSITQSYPALVTTTYDGINPAAHDYGSGIIIRLLIPEGFGMRLAHEFIGTATVVNASQFTLPVDTTFYDPFVLPPYMPGMLGTPAQVVPVGEDAYILTMATQNVLPYP